MHNQIVEKINYEIVQIERLLDTHKLLIDFCKLQEPGSTELAAIGSILQSFYNGIEKIFIFIARDLDKDFPKGEKWHRDLIKSMNSSKKDRKKVISNEIADMILNYLGFRHFFRHSYDFQLNWEMIRDNFLLIRKNWVSIKKDIVNFINE